MSSAATNVFSNVSVNTNTVQENYKLVISGNVNIIDGGNLFINGSLMSGSSASLATGTISTTYISFTGYATGAAVFADTMTTNSQFKGNPSNTGSLPSYSFTNDTTTGLFHPVSGSVAISSLGNEVMRISPTGVLTTASNFYIGVPRQGGLTNVALGQNALYNQLTTATSVVAIGNNAMFNGGGNYNTAIGGSAGYSMTGDNNTVLGYNAGYGSALGNANTYLGAGAGYSCTNPNYNTAVGYNALMVNSGQSNIALGLQAAYQNTVGSNNIVVGVNSQTPNITDSNVLLIGDTTGGLFGRNLYTSNFNLGIGTTSPKNKLDVNGSLAIGSYAGVTTGPTNGLLVSGNVGINTSSVNNALEVMGTTSTTNITFTGYATGASIYTNTLTASIMTGSSLLTFNTATGATLGVNTANVNTLNAITMTGSTLLTFNTATGSTFGVNTAFVNTLTAKTMTGSTLLTFNTATGSTLGVNTAFVNTLTSSTMTGSTLLTFNTATGATLGVNTASVNATLAAGKVGVGINNPSFPIHVYSAIGATNYISTSNSLYLQDSNVNSDGGGSLIFGASAGYFAGIKGGLANDAQNTNGNLYFCTRTNTSDTNLSTKLTVFANGNIGIGTVTPTVKLDMFDTSTCLMQIKSFTGGNSYAGILLYNTGAAGAALFLNSSSRSTDGGAQTLTLRNDIGMLRLQDSTVSGITITGGKVGVATSSPSYILQVGAGGRLAISNGPGSLTIIGTQENDGVENTRIVLSESTRTTYGGNIEYVAATGAGGNHIFYKPGVIEAVRISKTGYVGIGTSTPNAPLQFANTIANRKVVCYDGYNNDHQFYGFGINASMLRYQVDSGGACHAWYAGSSSTTSNELMRLQGNGYLGLGTTSPAVRLHVSESSTTATATYLKVTNASNQSLGAIFGQDASNNVLVYNQANAAILFATNNTETMRISSVGNVGIGTSSPNAALQLGNTTGNRRIVLWESVNNDHQFYGFGINSYMLRYQIPETIGTHAFFAATSSSASTELMRIQGNGNVGIGTSSPSSKLQIYTASTGAEISITTDDGNKAKLGLYERSDRQWGSYVQYNGGNDNIEFGHTRNYVMNNPDMVIDLNGTVGIANTSPNTYFKLDVNGYINSTMSRAGSFESLTTNNVTPLLAFYNQKSGGVSNTTSYVGQILFYGWDNGGNNQYAAGIYVPAVEQFTSSAHGAYMDFYTTQWTTPDAKIRMRIGGSSGYTYFYNSTSSNGAYIVFDSTAYSAVGSRIYSIGSTCSSNTPGAGFLEFFDNTAGSTRMIIDSSGNVGIGKTSVGYGKLDIAGNIRVNPSSGNANVRMTNSTYYSDFGTESASPYRTFINVVGNYPFSVLTDSNERMRILGDGKVGIGTTSPGTILTTVSASQYTVCATFGDGTSYVDFIPSKRLSTNANGWITIDGNGSSASSQGIAVWDNFNVDTSIYVGGATVASQGRIEINGTVGSYSLYATNTIRVGSTDYTSDARIKTNIVPVEIQSCLDMVKQYQVVSYDYKNPYVNAGTGVVGFIAQQIQIVDPNAVSTSTDFIPNVNQQVTLTYLHGETGSYLYSFTISTGGLLENGDLVQFCSTTGAYVNNFQYNMLTGSDTLYTFESTELLPESIFCYGKQVNNFHNLKKDRLFAYGIGAIQDLSIELDNAKQTIVSLQEQNQTLTQRLTTSENNYISLLQAILTSTSFADLQSKL